MAGGPRRPKDEQPSDASPLIPEHASLEQLRKAAADCQACDLWERGTQTVFGEGGGKRPRIVLVGEQPGDREDLEGRPFGAPDDVSRHREFARLVEDLKVILPLLPPR